MISRTEFDAFVDVTITSPAEVTSIETSARGAEAGASLDFKYSYHGLPKNSCSMQRHGDTDSDQILKVVQSPTATPSGRRNARFDQSDLS